MGYAGHHGHVLRVIPRYVDVDDGRDDALIGSATSDAVRTNRDQSTGATPHSASRRLCAGLGIHRGCCLRGRWRLW